MGGRSLRFRLTVALFLVALAAVGIVAVLAAGTTTSQFSTYVQHGPQMMMGRRILLDAAEQYSRQGGWGKASSMASRLARDYSARVMILDSDGSLLADSEPDADAPPGRPQALLLPDGRIAGYLLVGPAGAGAAERVFLATTYRWLAVGALLAAGLALLAGTIVSKRFTAPLAELTAASRRMAAGDHAARVEARGGAELIGLGEAFNDMAKSVESSEALRRRLIGDVAHELRTPIATLRSRLEALRDGVLPTDEATLATLADEVLVLSSLVDDLQELSLAESGALRYEKEPVDLGTLVAEEAERFRVGLEAKGVALEVSCPEALTVVADRKRLGQVIRNLLDNAAKHTESGAVSVRCLRAEGGAAVEVADTGAGISEDALPYVFERFYRADQSRERRTGGTGIGLTISRRIVEDHGGRIEAGSVPGKGTTMSVWLPL
jgi:two-component system sensor histidine kinase BaeS